MSTSRPGTDVPSEPAPCDPAGSGDHLVRDLRTRNDDELATLLRHRPDLATPAPSSITALASRAASPASLNRAVAALDRPTLTVLEALVVHGPASPAALDALVGFEAGDAVDALVARALVLRYAGTLCPLDTVRAVTGPSPLGLGPSLRDLGQSASDGWPTTPVAARAKLTRAPEGAKRALAALTWGPAAGSFQSTPPAVQWLIDQRIVHPVSSTRVVLPRDVALALRGDRLVRHVELSAPMDPAPQRPRDSIAAESVGHGEAIVREVRGLVQFWSEEPAAVLRTGGLGVRSIRALAEHLSATPERGVLVVELAGMASLLGTVHRGDDSAFAPTRTAAVRMMAALPQAWAEIAEAWLHSDRAIWLVGTRSDKGAVRNALTPEVHRSGVSILRRRVLEALSRWPERSAPDTAGVHRHLTWHTPRSAPSVETVAAILREASALGITGAGALSAAGRALLEHADLTAVAATFEADLPPAVEDLIIQSDLTGIVPGRPAPDLADLLERTAVVESRGSAMTVRFTPGSLATALEAGLDADVILTRLRHHCLTGVPQPLEYLIADVSRRHGRVRVGSALSFVRSEDPSVLAGMLADTGLGALGLRSLAPTVLIAEVEPDELAEALRAAGHHLLVEGPGGVLAAQRARVHATASLPHAPTVRSAPDDATVATIIARMRQREQSAESSQEPAQVLHVLDEASKRGDQVSLMIADPRGDVRSHRVRPLSVSAGRVRAVDVVSQTEIIVAAHRIVGIQTD